MASHWPGMSLVLKLGVTTTNKRTMSNFLFVNSEELSALMELPHIQRVAYLMEIRPYMDRKTMIVGIKRRISYQSIRETLYVGPIAGVKTGAPSIQQVRRTVNSLERAGLVSIQSTQKHLVLKCILAETHFSDQNKADTRPTPKSATNQTSLNQGISMHHEDIDDKSRHTINLQADIPHNSVNNIIYLEKQFEKFWLIYPLKRSKLLGWKAFLALNPDENLFNLMMSALQKQITYYQIHEELGHWLPNWKYSAKWIERKCWLDELNIYPEKNNTKHKKPRNKKQSVDPFWTPGIIEIEKIVSDTNIVHFPRDDRGED